MIEKLVLGIYSHPCLAVLSGGFRESRGTKRDDEFPANQSPISDTYGYDSDSDLGDDDDDELDISHDARQELPNKVCYLILNMYGPHVVLSGDYYAGSRII